MPVFLRWLLVDIVVVRILRHHRVRPYVDRVYPVLSRYGAPRGTVYTVRNGYQRVRRRRLSCCSGCLVMVAALTLGIILLAALIHWAM